MVSEWQDRLQKVGMIMTIDVVNKINLLLENATEYITEWECTFLNSIKDQLNHDNIAMHGNTLSPAQLSTFDVISQKYSTEALQREKEWVLNYDEEKKRTALLIAKYYLKAGYFSTIANKILASQGDFIVSQLMWNKICENKYAKRVIEENNKPFKFEVGELVELSGYGKSRYVSNRGNRLNYKRFYSYQNDGSKKPSLFMVLKQYPDMIYSAAKGAKRYRVIPMEFLSRRSNPHVFIDLEERSLKKLKKSK